MAYQLYWQQVSGVYIKKETQEEGKKKRLEEKASVKKTHPQKKAFPCERVLTTIHGLFPDFITVTLMVSDRILPQKLS